MHLIEAETGRMRVRMVHAADSRYGFETDSKKGIAEKGIGRKGIARQKESPCRRRSSGEIR